MTTARCNALARLGSFALSSTIRVWSGFFGEVITLESGCTTTVEAWSVEDEGRMIEMEAAEL
jgi:hypothetical protein